jgi:NADH-quinone oxidoreductase subunit F
MIRDTSLCGLGQTAPNPVLTTMRHFRHEFEDHIRAKRCRAGVCEDLALSPCENSCPLHMNIPRFLSCTRRTGWRTPSRLWCWTIRCPPRPAASASTPATTAAGAARRRIGEHARRAPLHRRLHLQSDRFERAGGACIARASCPHGPQGGGGRRGAHGPDRAFYLALLGHEVTVYESNAEAGGMLRYALPEYRLPKECCAARWNDPRAWA